MSTVISLLPTLTRASPLPSGRPDVTAASSQSEGTVGEWTSSEAIRGTSPSSPAESDGQQTVRGADSVTDLRTAGQNCVDMMAYTVTQTNLTFSHLVSRLRAGWVFRRGLV